MHIIEPCCARRHLMALRDEISKGGTMEFEGNGDLSLTELLPAMLTHYSDTELLIAAPSMPDQAADIMKVWMRQKWTRADGKGKLDAVRHLTIVADLSAEKSPVISDWLKDNPFAGRLTLVDLAQEDTAILLPDFAITGPVNMRYGHPFTATATTEPDAVKALWDRFLDLTGKPEERKPAVEEPVSEEPTREEPLEEEPGEEQEEQEDAADDEQPAEDKDTAASGKKRKGVVKR